jgi:hypothetical protein
MRPEGGDEGDGVRTGGDIGERGDSVSGRRLRSGAPGVGSEPSRRRRPSPMFDRVEEGTYREDRWAAARVWNGDQTDWGLNFASAPQILHVKLTTY